MLVLTLKKSKDTPGRVAMFNHDGEALAILHPDDLVGRNLDESREIWKKIADGEEIILYNGKEEV